MWQASDQYQTPIWYVCSFHCSFIFLFFFCGSKLGSFLKFHIRFCQYLSVLQIYCFLYNVLYYNQVLLHVQYPIWENIPYEKTKMFSLSLNWIQKDLIVKCATEEDIVPSFISLCPCECVKLCSFMGSFKREDNWLWGCMEKCMRLNHTHNWRHNFLIVRRRHHNLSDYTEHETILKLHSNNHHG